MEYKEGEFSDKFLAVSKKDLKKSLNTIEINLVATSLNSINERTKMVTIQRSKGYASRPTLSVERIGELISFIKSIRSNIICMVDNCYGEFVEIIEPSDVGADLVVGSLIKNPGGGIAPTGGYVCGKGSGL